ncbi:MAG TPA: amino acid adenylation domain-containing protein, partial [Pyrinomonadaceae bacterium]|nr:amino acid adenylation domain-containing protein [Pyrinomonadaceae bacterium]
MKTLHLGGEQLTRSTIEQLSGSLGDDCVIYNGYGPTEASVNCAIFSMGAVTAAREQQVDHVPIGRVTANNTLYILDQSFEPLPVGVYGEVYVGGAGLTSGYLRRPDLTAALFAPHPFGKQAGERLYRTGDVGRYLEDGNIECRGRIDHQVKIRGFRVEPGEVEAVLVQHPRVSAAAVDAQADGAGNLRLVAYLTPDVMPGPTTEELRVFMKQRLPQHMVPSIFVTLDQLPLNANGKLDRKALPEPELSGREQYAGPRTPVEELLAGIFAEVLKLERVGRDENFFELGGHSLLATQVVSRVQLAFVVELPLRALFETPTVAGLAGQIEQLRRAGNGVTVRRLQAVERSGKLPLSFAQQRLWFIDQLEPESAAYNIPAAVRLRGKLNVEALRRSFAEVVRRHEVLRTRFVTEAGEPQQVIGNGWKFELPLLDLSHLPEVERETAAREWAAREAAQPFVLSEGPLLRLALARVSEEEHVLAVTMHHIISDGWSVGVLIREVSALYEAYSRGEESPLAELEVQYGDFAVWQREWLQGEVLEQQLGYWREQLTDLVPLELPTDRARPAVPSHAGEVLTFDLNAEMTAGLQALSRRSGVTLFMTILAGFQLLLSKYSNQSDVAVGTDVANRNRAETEGLIGFFINQLVLRSEVNDELTFSELLKQVRTTTLEAYEHQDLPFERLVESLMPERDLSRTPLFQVKLVMQNAPREQMQLTDLELETLPVETQQTKFDLTLFLEERNDHIAGKLEYACDLFDAGTVERLIAHWQTILNHVVSASRSRVSEIELLQESEIQQLLDDGTGPIVSLDETNNLPALIAEQAQAYPHRIALEEFDRQLTYQSLNECANQLARHLLDLGVTSGTTVVICMKRSLELVIGLLGVLKAGAAYLALDPNDPAERLAYMLDETQAPVLLTQASLVETLPATLAHVICLDDDWETIASCDKDNPDVSVPGENLAYVIYTSGSTGKPKGVMVTHTGLANYIDWSRTAYEVESGNGSPVHSSLSFDLSVTSLWTILAGGARVQLFADGDEADQLGAEMKAGRGYSLIKLTPTHLQVLEQIVGDEQVQHAAAALVIGGEALRYENLRDWQQRMPGCRLINEYGPTETVVGSCIYEVAEGCSPTGEVPIGRPIANTEVYVIHKAQQVLPVGVYGELCIGGAGLARGYLNRPELTAERFVPHPYSTTGGARMYRTGDVARWNAGGQLEFRGRADHQVKIHGYRIELGEIEAA